MTEMAQRQELGQAVPLAALFTAFLAVSLYGVGGGSGIAATAAGLLIATGIRLLLPHRRRSVALLFAGLAFGLITFAKLPLLAVLFVLVPLSIALAGIEKARAR